MKAVKAGFVEAPCLLLTVDGMDRLKVAMQVARVERDLDATTFFGRGIFAKDLTKLTVANGTFVQVR